MYSNTNITPYLKWNKKQDNIKKILSLVLITFMIFNFIPFSQHNYQNNTQMGVLPTQEFYDENEMDLNPSAGISLFQDPFTVNFDKIWNFFSNNYKTDLYWGIDTYFRTGDASGTITDDTVYPIDTLTLYNTLLRDDLDWMELYDNYLALKTTSMWYEETESKFSYGFVSSIDNSTGQISDDRRSLIDNLMPISMLIENMGDNIASLYSSTPIQYPKDSIEEMFYLVNSSQFWDSNDYGFSEYNSTDFTENKDTKSNLYAILANLQIRNAYEHLSLNPTIKNRAYELANMTMDKLLVNMWDDTDDGFYRFASNDWSTGALGATYKYLDTNALGIITLLEYWLETGMTDSTLLDKAIATYDQIEQYLEYGSTNTYHYSADRLWYTSIQDHKVDLEANALFMLACLKLFEVTGDITYYNTAFDLHNALENNFYDSSVNAYDNSIYVPVDDGKNLNANLKLIDTYMKAIEIYSSTVLTSSFNVSSEVPDFIFNEHELNIDTIYQVEKDFDYFNYTTNTYETSQLQFNITSADATYLIKYPNGTLFEMLEQVITGDITTLKYAINDTMPIGQNYDLYIYANSSNFGTAQILKNFNIISGLVNHTIEGLPDILYQGPTLNVTIPINNTRNKDVSLTITMEEEDIITESQILLFPSMQFTDVSFNLTAKLGASIGAHKISFKFEIGNILYLEVIKVVNIGHSFDYDDLIYENKVVKGQSFQVSLNLINFLPNSTQSMNVSFSSPYIQNIKEELTLLENEVRLVFYDLLVSEDLIDDSITVDMKISKGKTNYYTKSIEIDILPTYEIKGVFFPQAISQGNIATFTLIIENNKGTSEAISLYVNGEKWTANINRLAPGENRIIAEVVPTLIPYDFIAKTYTFELRNSIGEPILQYYFEVSIELSPTNLILFYVLPILIPIGIILFYKNKELKHKLLRR